MHPQDSMHTLPANSCHFHVIAASCLFIKLHRLALVCAAASWLRTLALLSTVMQSVLARRCPRSRQHRSCSKSKAGACRMPIAHQQPRVSAQKRQSPGGRDQPVPRMPMTYCDHVIVCALIILACGLSCKGDQQPISYQHCRHQVTQHGRCLQCLIAGMPLDVLWFQCVAFTGKGHA